MERSLLAIRRESEMSSGSHSLSPFDGPSVCCIGSWLRVNTGLRLRIVGQLTYKRAAHKQSLVYK
jgi:hypothetical protein